MQTEHLKITGMTYGGCTTKIARALKTISGVGGVDVSLASEEATVQYDDKLTSVDKLKLAIISAGYGVGAGSSAKKSESKGGCCG